MSESQSEALNIISKVSSSTGAVILSSSDLTESMIIAMNYLSNNAFSKVIKDQGEKYIFTPSFDGQLLIYVKSNQKETLNPFIEQYIKDKEILQATDLI